MANIGNGAVSGQVNETVTAVSGVSSYAVQATDQLVQVTTGAGVVNVSLLPSQPAGSFTGTNPAVNTTGQPGTVGLRVTVQKVDTAGGTVNVLGTLNIGSGYKLASRWSSATFQNDGTLWNLVATVS